MMYVGFHIPERFRPVKTLVEGDFEITITAVEKDRETDKEVVIRTVRFPEKLQTTLTKKLKEELSLVKQLTFSFLPSFRDIIVTKNVVVYSFDAFEGTPLIKLIPMKGEQAAVVFASIANALLDLHGQDIAHMHLNPYTIFVDERGGIKITDVGFGAAYKMLASSEILLPYASPEMLKNEHSDWRSDFFSFGALLWHTLTGEIPQFNPEDGTVLFESDTYPAVLPFYTLLEQLLCQRPSERLCDALSIISTLKRSTAQTDSRAGKCISTLSGTVPLISRRAELNRVIATVEQFLATGIDQTMLLIGDHGVGRTRFMEEVSNRMSERLHTLLLSAAATQDLVGDIITSLWEKMPQSERTTIASQLGDIIALYFPRARRYTEFENIQPAQRLQNNNEDFSRVVSVIGEIINRSTKTSPLLLLVDNADETDNRSREIVRELLNQEGKNNRLFVLASVSSDANAEIVEFPTHGHIEILPFSQLEVRSFLEQQFSHIGLPIDDEMLAWIHKESQGKVRQIIMILSLLVQEGYLYRDNTHIFVRSTVLNTTTLLLLKRWFDSLGKDSFFLLKAISVYYRFTTKEALTFILNDRMGKEEIAISLEMFKNNYLLKEQKNGRIRLISEQLKQFLYAQLEPQERILLHQRFSNYLITSQDVNNVRLNIHAYAAYHAKQARDYRRALRFYLYSSKTVVGGGSGMQLQTILKEIIGIKEKHAELLKPGQQYAIDLFAGQKYYLAGNYREAIPLLEKAFSHWNHYTIIEYLAFALARESRFKHARSFIQIFGQKKSALPAGATSNDKRAFIHFLIAISADIAGESISLIRHHVGRVNSLLNRHYKVLFSSTRLYMLKELEFRMRMYALGEEQFDILANLSESLLQQAKETGKKNFVADSLFTLFQFYWQFNKLHKAHEILKRALTVATELYDNFRISRIYYHLAVCTHRLSRWNECGYHLDRAMEFANKSGGTQILRLAFFAKGEYALISGDYTAADNFLNQAERHAEQEKTSDIITIYTAQIILNILKQNLAQARSIGGKSRRLLERQTIPAEYRVSGLISLMLLEAFVPRDNDFFEQLKKESDAILRKKPQSSATYRLLYLLTFLLRHSAQNKQRKAYAVIEQVEKEHISSTHSLFKMMYYYYASRFLLQYDRNNRLLEEYLEIGRNVANHFNATNFLFLFRELVYFIGRDENATIIHRLKTTAQRQAPEMISDINKLQTHVEETEKLLDHFRLREENFLHISELIKSISGRSDIRKILDIVVRKIISTLHVTLCAVMYRYGRGEEQEYFIKNDLFEQLTFNDITLHSPTISRMMESGHIEITPQNTTLADGATSDYTPFSVAAVPLDLHGEMESYLYIQHHPSVSSFNDTDIHFLTITAEYVGIILENVRLIEIATKDTLTRVATRRAFLQALSREIRRSERYVSFLSILMLDIDFFKRINDNHGHLMGDNILRALGHILNDNIRNTDYAGRLGGEEFAVLLTNTDKNGAVNTAEKIRTLIERTPFSSIRVTVSIGVATFSGKATLSPTDFIEKSDVALYTAKRNGRNNTVHYDDITAAEQE